MASKLPFPTLHISSSTCSTLSASSSYNSWNSDLISVSISLSAKTFSYRINSSTKSEIRNNFQITNFSIPKTPARNTIRTTKNLITQNIFCFEHSGFEFLIYFVFRYSCFEFIIAKLNNLQNNDNMLATLAL